MAPDWEDPANRAGGRWQLSFNTGERKDLLDQRWLEVLISALGGKMGSLVTGRLGRVHVSQLLQESFLCLS